MAIALQRALVRLECGVALLVLTVFTGYLHPTVLNVSFRGRLESSRFDDDQNRLRLDRLFVADLTLDRPLSEAWVVFVSLENLLNRRYPVQATPVELLGTPFTITGGLRFDLRPR